MSVIIAADIGGTNCRLGLYTLRDGQLSLEKGVWIRTSDLADTGQFVSAMESELELKLDGADAMVAAIAGPVEAYTRGGLTNGTLRLDLEEHRAAHVKLRVCLINDFMAQAYAILGVDGIGAKQVAGPTGAPMYATRAVIGAGTGLGAASVVWVGNDICAHGKGGWMPVAAEYGHTVFPFVNDAENDYRKFLCSRLDVPFATGDVTITGRGLEILHEYLTGEKLAAADVGKLALCGETETLVWYSRFYGRACRNWMLSTLCAGGLWIAGGIAAQNPYCVENEHFLAELHGHSDWETFLKDIPVYLMMNKDSGLWGAARLGAMLLES